MLNLRSSFLFVSLGKFQSSGKCKTKRKPDLRRTCSILTKTLVFTPTFSDRGWKNLWELIKCGLISPSARKNSFRSKSSINYTVNMHFFNIQVVCQLINKQGSVCLLFYFFIILVPVLSMLVINTGQSFILASVVKRAAMKPRLLI